MNRAARLLQLRRERDLVEFQLMVSGVLDRINQLGPDLWLRRVYGLSGRAAESAWWGVLDVMGELLKKERRR